MEQITLQPKSIAQENAVSSVLDKLFPEQQHEEKIVQKTKDILGEVSNELSPEELKCTIAETQFLAEAWLDDFERKIFNGLTLKELLHEKGSL